MDAIWINLACTGNLTSQLPSTCCRQYSVHTLSSARVFRLASACQNHEPPQSAQSPFWYATLLWLYREPRACDFLGRLFISFYICWVLYSSVSFYHCLDISRYHPATSKVFLSQRGPRAFWQSISSFLGIQMHPNMLVVLCKVRCILHCYHYQQHQQQTCLHVRIVVANVIIANHWTAGCANASDQVNTFTEV